MSPLICLTGPAEDGITSKSKISVGSHSVAQLGSIDHAGDMALARRGAQDRIGLRAGIAEFLQIRDREGEIGCVSMSVVLLPFPKS